MVEKNIQEEKNSQLKLEIEGLTQNIKSAFGKNNKNNPVLEHMIDTLDNLNKNVYSLEKNIALGVPLTESGKNVERLSSLVKEVKSFEPKISLYSTKTNELEKKMLIINKKVSEKVNKKQLDSLVEKIENLEKIYSNTSIAKTNESVKSVIEIINKLESRVKYLEDRIKNEVGDEVDRLTLNNKIDRMIVENKKENKVGFFDKIKRMFGG